MVDRTEAELLQEVAELERAAAETPSRRLAHLEDYVFDKAQEAFWDLQDGTLHSEKSVDASIPLERWPLVDAGLEEPEPEAATPRRGRPRNRPRLQQPSAWIKRVENDQFVEGSTWWPGRPQIVVDYFISADGIRPAVGRRIYNQYRPPDAPQEGSTDATPWVEHVRRLWPSPDEHEYFFNYCAHMLQRPEEKCNAAIVLSGTQGIGKDAALDPIKHAVGSWNHKGIDPDALFSPFKPWLQTLMLIVDEVRPSKDEFHATSMYNVLKPLVAAPPDTLPLNDKHQQLRYVINVMRVFLTTNDWMAMYIPPEDRRMFIMHSTIQQRWHVADGDPEYFVRFFAWLAEGGRAAVARWLMARDLSAFNPKGDVAKTMGWAAVAGSWGTPEDSVSDALDKLARPPVLFGQELAWAAAEALDGSADLAALMKHPRRFVARMQRENYLLIPCPDAQRWEFKGAAKRVRARYAFVRSDHQANPLDLIRSRGRAMAEG